MRRTTRMTRCDYGLDTDPAASWQTRAACRDVDPELFFPDSWSDSCRQQIEQAKAICRRCPVVDQCLADALAVGDEHAVRGGTTPAERGLGRPPKEPDATCEGCGREYRRVRPNQTHCRTCNYPDHLQPCGTRAAYRRHKARGEQPCELCKEAHRTYEAQRSDRPARHRPKQPCGTRAAYRRHKARGEQPCKPCQDAYNEANRQWKRSARKRQAQAVTA